MSGGTGEVGKRRLRRPGLATSLTAP